MTESRTSTCDDALLDALRCNLSLLHELTLRYGVETRPDPTDDRRPVINGPDDVQRLLGPEMAGWPRSRCGCCSWTPRTASSASG